MHIHNGGTVVGCCLHFVKYNVLCDVHEYVMPGVRKCETVVVIYLYYCLVYLL